MSRPKLVDLFCGAGGAAVGYVRAGFDVVGVDIEPKSRYPFEFHQADAMTFPLDGFDAVHASPPCHDHSPLRTLTGLDHGTGWMLQATINRLTASGLPWVVENVSGAEMGGYWVVLCGSMFGLGVRRHRQFASNLPLLVPPCDHRGQGPVIGVYGHPGGYSKRDGRVARSDTAGWKVAMGIDWMTARELAQAIPPAYTEFLGAQMLDHIAERAA